jgi:hypothetical protein
MLLTIQRGVPIVPFAFPIASDTPKSALKMKRKREYKRKKGKKIL